MASKSWIMHCQPVSFSGSLLYTRGPTDHAECVTQNLVGLFVVDIANVVERDEELEGVLGVGLAGATPDLLLDLVLALLPVTGEAEELVLVCPENRLVLPHVHAGQDVVQMDNGILGMVADHDEEAALLLLDAIADERGNPRVSVFFEKSTF